LRDRFDNGLQSELGRERSESELRAILEARLRTALLDAGLAPDPRNPLDPLPPAWPQNHARRQTRAVLAEARFEVERQLGEASAKPSTDADVVEQLDSRWKVALDAVADVPEDDADLLDLLGWAAGTARFAGVSAKPGAVTKTGTSTFLDLVHSADGATRTTRVFMLSGASQGGRLLRRIKEAINRRGGHRAVAVRLESFPANPATQSAEQLLALISPDGTRVRPTADELRRLAAYKEFVGAESGTPGFADWAKQASIIEGCESVAVILGVVGGSGSRAEMPANEVTAPRAIATTAVAEVSRETGAPSVPPANGAIGGRVRLGLDERRQEVELEPAALLKHAAVLGGSGSGKTTFILNVVEELVQLGVPAVLVDRKGDFATYAAEAAWRPTGNAERDRRRKELHQRLEVAVYTPGKSAGRPLMLKLLPADIGELSEEDRREATRSAADALADMIALKSGAKDGQRREVLAQAVAQSAEAGGDTLDLAGLVELLHEGAPGLENLLRYLDPQARLRKELAQRLEALRLGRQELFAATGEPLDFAALLSGRSGIRMSVVSLAFMPEVADQQFFVSRLLAEARRHCRRSPSSTLQGVLVLDEADLYLPAQANPATKAPLLDLLRRARSGGIGIILGTQSPADLDYKGRDNIATWALGHLQTRRAIDKVSFAAEGTSFDLNSILPSFKTGQFLVRSENVHALVQGHRSQIETRQLGQDEILAVCRH
jgi:DNA helicase HerA-like ATPase